ncbi:outer membrane beta-barrel protein [Helicobacter muridarum]|uniref:Outer membrane beta-barrel protein n=1 Tax=Helicobacter muridarum TaxID=216 RepID=A0A377PVQ8_9HELI|nr:outer membrane beta-barrel protein [Helicobacter muridarum]TLE00224.1 outer membrane beta-barrel protein [Helicobacter muridarum]STQ85713.1 outer membrane protein [Helicobacter muridarum]
MIISMCKIPIKNYLLIYSALLCSIWLHANAIDFQDNDNGLLNKKSYTQEQVKLLQPVLNKPKIAKNKTQNQLLKQESIKRDGYYILVSYNIASINRSNENSPQVNIISSGFGIRGGMISYLDSYIGIRGYFGLDFTNDNLAIATLNKGELQRIQNIPKYSGTMILASLGIDILIDFFMDKTYRNTFGFFIGVGAGVLVYFDNKTPMILSNGTISKYAWGANVTVQGGATITITHKNKFEIGIKLLPTQSLTIDNNGVLIDFSPYIAYSYKF